ncbi:MAG: Coenzyme F420 hydrogenase/dehydrogenase, beta subunit C-terminal domain [Cetobacterium sp.]
MYLRPSCYRCSFKGLDRERDITLADFWGIENIAKKMDDNKGTSLVFINSKSGKNIFEKIEANIKIKEIEIEEAIKYNLSAIKSSYENPRKKYFFKNIEKYKFDKLVQKSLKDSLDIRIKVIKIIRYLKKKYLNHIRILSK